MWQVIVTRIHFSIASTCIIGFTVSL